jgi:hypothetical protein
MAIGFACPGTYDALPLRAVALFFFHGGSGRRN